MAFGFGGGLLDGAMGRQQQPQPFQPQFQPPTVGQQGGFSGGGGIFGRLRQQFPQLFGNQGAQQFGGQQPILNQQVPGQFTGQNQPVLNQQPQPPTAVQFGGQQPVLNQIPGVQSVVPPGGFIGDSFGAQPQQPGPPGTQFVGGQMPILRQATPGAQQFGGSQPVLNQNPGVQQFAPGQMPILRQAPPQGIQPFGGPQQQQPILNQLPLGGGREQLLQNKANLGFGGIQ